MLKYSLFDETFALLISCIIDDALLKTLLICCCSRAVIFLKMAARFQPSIFNLTYLFFSCILTLYAMIWYRKSFCFHRLAFLAYKFNAHKLLNELDEVAQMQKTTYRDFYNIRKVTLDYVWPVKYETLAET